MPADERSDIGVVAAVVLGHDVGEPGVVPLVGRLPRLPLTQRLASSSAISASRRRMKPSSIGMGFSHQSVPSLSKTAIRSVGRDQNRPRLRRHAATKSTIAAFADRRSSLRARSCESSPLRLGSGTVRTLAKPRAARDRRLAGRRGHVFLVCDRLAPVGGVSVLVHGDDRDVRHEPVLRRRRASGASPGSKNTRSPARIVSTGPPCLCARPMPLSTKIVWPFGWVCQ